MFKLSVVHPYQEAHAMEATHHKRPELQEKGHVLGLGVFPVLLAPPASLQILVQVGH